MIHVGYHYLYNYSTVRLSPGEKGTENLFNQIISENIWSLKRKLDTQVREAPPPHKTKKIQSKKIYKNIAVKFSKVKKEGILELEKNTNLHIMENSLIYQISQHKCYRPEDSEWLYSRSKNYRKKTTFLHSRYF